MATDEQAAQLLHLLCAPEHWTDIQVDSFNFLLQRGLQWVFSDIRPIVYIDRRPGNTGTGLSITFENPVIRNITLHAGTVALTRQYLYQNVLSYQGALHCQFVLKIFDNTHTEKTIRFPNFFMGKFPVMVGSAACSDQPKDAELRGYFIVNGQDKVIVVQERVVNNRLLLFVSNTAADVEQHTCEVRSTTCNMTRVPLILQIRMTVRNQQPNAITVSIPFFRTEVPLMYIMLILGCKDHAAALQAVQDCLLNLGLRDIAVGHLMLPSMLECTQLMDQQQLMVAIAACMLPVATDVTRHSLENLTGNILPHLGATSVGATAKLQYVTYMTSILLASVCKKVKPCSRDSYTNKRLELPHTLLMQQLRSCLLRQRGILERNIAKGMSCASQGLWKAVQCWGSGQQNEHAIQTIITGMLQPHNMTRGLSYAMLTGNWVTHASSTSFSSSSPSTGVVQLLQCYNQISRISHLRRINTPQEKMGKLNKPRFVHPSSFGVVCPVETPEGPVCGLLTTIAIGVRVSFDPSPQLQRVIRQKIHDTVAPLLVPAGSRGCFIFYDGCILGQTLSVRDCFSLLKPLTGLWFAEFNVHVSVSLGFDNCLYIDTDGGRPLRFLLRVMEGRTTIQNARPEASHMSLDDLVKAGHLIVVDPAMSQWMHIASHWSASLLHADACEIHMQAMLGLAATLIPRIECNQSPRNSYQSAMTKQSVGVWENTVRSLDTNFQFLVHAEKPLLQSNMNCGLVSAMGQNVMIAVSSYSGCNQNDAVVMSQGAIDNGLFSSYHATVVKIELRSHEFLHGVEADHRKKYHTLHPITGVVNCGVALQHGDGLVLFHKRDTEATGRESVRQQLRLLKHEEATGTVEQVDILMEGCTLRQSASSMHRHQYICGGRRIPTEVLQLLLRHLTANQTNSSIVIRIRVGGLRVPQMGDKFASRHGQKGTIGAILPVEDMPYVGSGVVPDLLFNSHGIPSRMTIGQLWEVVLSKFNLSDSNVFHGRCFDPGNTRALYKAFKLSDSEPLFSGVTGELLGFCSTGVAYYQRLKHMTRDKMHARALGPVTQMVRQPTDGRARAGGLRIGEMERDALIAHGCISFLNERLLWKSDAYRIVICSKCGSYPATQTMWLGTMEQNAVASCTGCKGIGEHSSVVVPYSFKLLLQEAASTGIAIYLQSHPSTQH